MGQHALKCKQCGARSSVLDSRTTLEGRAIKRRRECTNGHRWTTYELEISTITGKQGRPQTTLVLDAVAHGAQAADAYRELLALSQLLQAKLQRL